MKYWILTIALMFLFGCAQTDSEDVSSESIYPTFSIEENVSGEIRCEARFQVGGPTGTYLNLSAGESVTCNGTSMERGETALGEVYYHTAIALDESIDYDFVFNRSDGNSYNVSLQTITDVTISSPSTNQNVVKGSILTLGWDAGPSNSEVDVTIEYTQSSGGSSQSQSYNLTSIDDGGSHQMTATETTIQSGATGTFSGSIVIERSVQGAFSAGLTGRTISKRRGSVDFNLVDP